MKETLEPTEAEIVTQFKDLYDQLTNTEQSILKNKSMMTKNILHGRILMHGLNYL